jgi:hypothetical protein
MPHAMAKRNVDDMMMWNDDDGLIRDGCGCVVAFVNR